MLSERETNLMAVLARWSRLCGRQVFTEADIRERMVLLGFGVESTEPLTRLAENGLVWYPSSEAITLTEAGRELALRMDVSKVAVPA